MRRGAAVLTLAALPGLSGLLGADEVGNQVVGLWPGWWWATFILLLLVVLGWFLSFTAGRVDRLHARVEAARAALDAQLVRRSAVALQLATSGELDPAASLLLAAAAVEARECDEASREAAESDLSRALRAVLDDEDAVVDAMGVELLTELGAAAQRVQLARRFHNDAVRATRDTRRSRPVRWFRLAGHAAMPASFEIDDEPPEGLPR